MTFHIKRVAMIPKESAYFSFLLRLWQEKRKGQLAWRASLENPHDGERLGFCDIDELLAFLADITQGDTSWNETNPAHRLGEN